MSAKFSFSFIVYFENHRANNALSKVAPTTTSAKRMPRFQTHGTSEYQDLTPPPPARGESEGAGYETTFSRHLMEIVASGPICQWHYFESCQGQAFKTMEAGLPIFLM